ncbi:MAG: hypothetical protein J6D53_01845 [Blautia sp.]|nr:hypothetical protein [Blautia sp.]
MRRKSTALFVTAVFTAALLTAGTVYAEAGEELSIYGGIGLSNDLAAPGMDEPVGGDVIALDDISISVEVPEYKVIKQEDGFVYIYTGEEGFIPYVIIGAYDFVSDNFADSFTEYMAGVYSDLDVTEAPVHITLNGMDFEQIGYEYSAGDYTISDTRLFTQWNSRTLMFGMKEVPETGDVIGANFLNNVAGSYLPLAGGDGDYVNHVDADRSVWGPWTTIPGDNDPVIEGPDPEPAPGSEGTVGGSPSSVGSGMDNAPDGQDEPAGRINFDESVAGYEGTWVSFEDGFRLYLPSVWSIYDLSDAQRNAGAIYMVYDGNNPVNPAYVEVDYTASEGITTLDEAAEILRYAGYTIDDILDVNGMPCVAYSSAERDLTGLMFFHPMSKDYIMVVIGGSYSGNTDTIASILCSLTPTV